MKSSFSNPATRRAFSIKAGLCAASVFLALSLPAQGASSTKSRSAVSPPAPGQDFGLRSLVSSKLGRVLVSDQRLDRVATWLATQAAAVPPDRGAVRDRLWREGIVDFEFSPISFVVPEGSADQAIKGVMKVLEDSSIPWSRYNTLAVSSTPTRGGVGVGLVLVRRVARVSGAGLHQARNKTLNISLSGEYREPRLFITAPHGTVVTRTAEHFDLNSWRADARPVGGAGTSLWELVADGPRGPEVLALWRRETPEDSAGLLRPRSETKPSGGSAPLAHNPYLDRSQGLSKEKQRAVARNPANTSLGDAGAAAWVVGARSGPNRAPEPADVALAEEHLWSLIQETRQSRGLLALRRVPALTRAARRHASDLGRGEQFGHETSSGNALTRIESQGVTALRATENVAVAANVVEVHAALMASPSHRANILDPEVSAGAVGVVLKRDSRGRWSAVASEVFAQLLADGPGDQWHSAILNRINNRRKALELAPLRGREKLDDLALHTSQGVLRSKTATLSRVERKEIASKARFHYLNVRRVGVDLLVTADPTGVDRIAHALESNFREIGVGIVRLTEPMGNHGVGALVITLIFIER